MGDHEKQPPGHVRNVVATRVEIQLPETLPFATAELSTSSASSHFRAWSARNPPAGTQRAARVPRSAAALTPTRFAESVGIFDTDHAPHNAICSEQTVPHDALPSPTGPSPAVSKMKTAAIMKEREALEYMKRFALNPYSAASAKASSRRGGSSRGHTRPSTAAASTAPRAGGATRAIPRPKSANLERHAIHLWGATVATESAKYARSRKPTATNVPATTLISSPLSAKLIAELKRLGVSTETAALVGAAVMTGHQTTEQTGGASLQMQKAAASKSASGIYDPTIAWPRAEPFVNHCAVHSKTKPIGAHTSGFYSKQTHADFVANIGQHVGPDSILSKLRITNDSAAGKANDATEIGFENGNMLLPKDVDAHQSQKSQSNPEKRARGHINEVALTEDYLCILTDPDCGVEQAIHTLSRLIELASTHENIGNSVLFDRGGVAIILHLMSVMPNVTEVQAKACYLLQIMATRNSLNCSSLKQEGLLTILAAVQTLSKDLQTQKNALSVMTEMQTKNAQKDGNKLQQATTTPITSNRRHRSKSVIGRTIGSLSHDGMDGKALDIKASAESLGSSNERLHASTRAGSYGGQLSTSRSASNLLLSASIVPSINVAHHDELNFDHGGTDCLVRGLLAKYFDPLFLSQLENHGKSAAIKIVKYLLDVFLSIDKLLHMVKLISIDTDMEIALDHILCEAEEAVNPELILLYLIDPASDMLIAADWDPWMDPQEKELLRDVRYPIGPGIVGLVVQTGEAVNIRDASRHERYDHEIDARGMNIAPTSLLSIPIASADGKLIGVIQAINRTSASGAIESFSPEDEFFLKAIARLAGLLIGNAQGYGRLKKSQEKVEVLLETTRSLGSTLELDLLVQRIMDSAKDLLMADRCTLFLSDLKAKQLRAHIQGRDTIEEIRIPINAGIAGFAYTSGESVNIHDVYKDSRFNPEVDKKTGYLTRNILCTPIRNISGQSIGVTQMINKKGGSFEADDEKLLLSFSAQAAVAIENSNLFKKTADMLRETRNMKNYLNMIIQSITNVVITLDKNGYISHINHPAKVEMTDIHYSNENSKHYEAWLGPENTVFVNDIRRAYMGEDPCIIAQDYELILEKTMNINYTIVQMSSSSEDETSEGAIPKKNEIEGVVIVLEDISSEKRALMTLGRYMSPALAKQVMAEDGGQLGGKRKKVAILFTDIRSFTEISESMEPQMVVEMLNHHFTDAVNAILAEQGILDKYIGDAVMAVFGVPFVSPDDSIHACNAALRIKDSLAEYNSAIRLPNGQTPLRIGIGVNTGIVLSGNIGSLKRMEFSCIGDAVNLSSRIEGMTKTYGVTILITEHTVAEIGDNFRVREVDSVIVKGKSKSVTIYELMGRKDDVPGDDVTQMLEYFVIGLRAYRTRCFDQAIECFGKALELVENDGPSRTLLERSREYRVCPPPENWAGVFHADSK
ncbi:hypothetical protein HDU83_001644 [Entophlyctis luteolus]|nr:hypothetical protein HDU83_001644 [Entophlyctis luteolus]